MLKITGATYDLKNDSLDGKLKPQFSEKRNIGFIAQEIKEYYPELVREDEDGYLALNYNGFIPILLELIKVQNSKISELENQLNAGSFKSAGVSDTNLPTDLNGTKLYQNAPNPFDLQTTIRYEIAEQVQNARLHICNMNGTLLKTIQINQKGAGDVVINGNEFNAGMYLYSLVCDGKIVDTKRMLLTE